MCPLWIKRIGTTSIRLSNTCEITEQNAQKDSRMEAVPGRRLESYNATYEAPDPRSTYIFSDITLGSPIAKTEVQLGKTDYYNAGRAMDTENCSMGSKSLL